MQSKLTKHHRREVSNEPPKPIPGIQSREPRRKPGPIAAQRYPSGPRRPPTIARTLCGWISYGYFQSEKVQTCLSIGRLIHDDSCIKVLAGSATIVGDQARVMLSKPIP